MLLLQSFVTTLAWSIGLPLLVVCALMLAFGVVLGVHLTVASLESPISPLFLLGLLMQIVSIVLVENLHRLLSLIEPSARSTKGFENLSHDLKLFQSCFCHGQRLVTLLKFAIVMDGGRRLMACGYVYLIYEAIALPLIVLRKKKTRFERLFIRWGWAPIISLGVPFLRPVFENLGWIRFIW